MRIFNSVSFWIVFWSALLSCFIGSFTHWIFGLIFFLILTGKTILIGLIMDTVSGSLEYHHDRQDDRMKKTMESIRYLKESGSSAASNIRSNINERFIK